MDTNNNNTNLVDAAGFSRYPHTVTNTGGSLPVNNVPDQNKEALIRKPTVSRSVGIKSTVSPIGLVDSLDVDASFIAPDPVSGAFNSRSRIPEIVNKIRKDAANSYYSKQNDYASMIARDQARYDTQGLSKYGDRVSVGEVYDIYKNGLMLPKYESFSPGRRNEEYNALRQSGWDKTVNGLGKFVTKTTLYGVGGVVGAVYGAGSAIKNLSLSAFFDNSFNDTLNMIDERINHQFAHYYTEQEKDMNFLQKLGTGNFWMNDIIGTGASFTVGAILSAYITGGLGMATLGSTGARVGMSAAAKLGRFGRAAAATKTAFGTLKRGATVGSAIGNTLKTTGQLFTGAAWEASVEANSYIRESEERFKDYIKATTGREATRQELDEFNETNIDAANSVFAANMGIVGLSNYMLLGKYLGLGSGEVGRFFKRNFSKVGNAANKYLFGLGVKKSATEAGKLVAINANRAQKIAAGVFNFSKRPLSEGLFEEGLQGVAQKAATEYIQSKYDKTRLEQTASVVDAISKGIIEQYTSKEGWVEIGAGAIIGAMFGVRQGFGLMERSNRAKEISAIVDNYNKNKAFTPESVKSTVRTMASLNMQLGDQGQNAVGFASIMEDSDSTYQKIALSESLGMLEEHADDFEAMVNSLDSAELAASMNTDINSVEEYKKYIINDFRKQLDNYRNASAFAEDVLGDLAVSDFKSIVGQTVYRGLTSVDRMKYAADSINKILDEDANISFGLSYLSILPENLKDSVERVRQIKEKIDNLNKQIESYALSPKRVNAEGVDTEAERIKADTQRLSELQEQYKREVSSLNNFVFDRGIFNVGERVSSLLSQTLTPEIILEAYDAMDTIESYIDTIDPKNMTDTEKLLVGLVNDYRDNVINLRAISSFMNQLGDRKFLTDYYKGFTKLASSFFKEGSESLSTDRDINIRDDKTMSDETIDDMVARGEMTEGEAYTYKILAHLGDRIAPRERVDSMSDEVYEEAKQPDYTGPELMNIAAKIFGAGKDVLSPRETEVYDIHKNAIDEAVRDMGGSLTGMINSLKNKLEKAEKREESKAETTSMISDIKDELDNHLKDVYIDKKDGSKDELNSFIEDQVLDNGEAARLLIEDYTANWLKKNGLYEGVDDVMTDALSSDDVVNSIRSEETGVISPKDSKGVIGRGERIACANPYMVVAKITGKKQSNLWFSNLKLEKFFDAIGIKEVVSVKSLGKNKYEYEIKYPDDTVVSIKIIKIKDGAFVISIDDARAMAAKSGKLVLPQKLTQKGFMVYTVNNGVVSPFLTGNGYGETETDFIDQQALSEASVGDDVSFVMEPNDAYNQKLWNEYNNTKDTDKKAKKTFSKGVVVKVLDKSGRLVSVMALRDASNFVEMDIDTIISEFEKGTQSIEAGTAKISAKLPGRINEKMDQDGNIVPTRVSAEDAANIVDVGYIQDGKLKLKNGEKCTVYPFASVIQKASQKGAKLGTTRIPVVVLKGPNGVNYVYPVSLVGNTTGEVSSLITTINNYLSNPDGFSDQQIFALAAEINAYVRKNELNYDEYSISPSGTMEDFTNSLKKVLGYLQTASDVNVVDWVTGDRSVEDIVTSDIMTEINFSEGMFVGPKIWIDSNGDEALAEVDDEDLPFGTGGTGTSSVTPVVEPTTSTTSVPVEPVTEPTATSTAEPVVTPPAAPAAEPTAEPTVEPTAAPETVTEQPSSGRTSAKKNFSKYRAMLVDKPYKNIFDFLCRALGDTLFINVDRYHKKDDIRKITGDENISRPKYTSKDGMTFDEIYNWLKSSKDQVVKDYLNSKKGTEEEIKESVRKDLAFLIKSIPNVTTALNYSLAINGLETISENVKNVDINSITDALNSYIENGAKVEDVAEEATNDISGLLSLEGQDLSARIEDIVLGMQNGTDITRADALKALSDSLETIKKNDASDTDIEKVQNAINDIIEKDKKAEEAQKAAEEAKKAEEARKAAEEARKAEEAKKAAEEAKRIEEENKKKKSIRGKKSTSSEKTDYPYFPGFFDNNNENNDDNGQGTEGQVETGANTESQQSDTEQENTEIAKPESGSGSTGGVVESVNNGGSQTRQPIAKTYSFTSDEISSERNGKGQNTINDNEWIPGIDKEVSNAVYTARKGPFVYSGRFDGVVGEDIKFRALTELEVKEDNLSGLSTADIKRKGFQIIGNWAYRVDRAYNVFRMYNIQTGEAFRIEGVESEDIKRRKFINSLSQSSRSKDVSEPTEVTPKNDRLKSMLEARKAKDESRKAKSAEASAVATVEEAPAVVGAQQEADKPEGVQELAEEVGPKTANINSRKAKADEKFNKEVVKLNKKSETILGKDSFFPGDEALVIIVDGSPRDFGVMFYRSKEGIALLKEELLNLNKKHSFNQKLSKGKFSDKEITDVIPPAFMEDMKNNPEGYKSKGRRDLLMEKALKDVVIPYFEASAQYAKTIEDLSTVAETNASVKPKRAGRKKPNVNIEDADFSESKNELNKDCTVKK